MSVNIYIISTDARWTENHSFDANRMFLAASKLSTWKWRSRRNLWFLRRHLIVPFCPNVNRWSHGDLFTHQNEWEMPLRRDEKGNGFAMLQIRIGTFSTPIPENWPNVIQFMHIRRSVAITSTSVINVIAWSDLNAIMSCRSTTSFCHNRDMITSHHWRHLCMFMFSSQVHPLVRLQCVASQEYIII